LTKLLYI